MRGLLAALSLGAALPARVAAPPPALAAPTASGEAYRSPLGFSLTLPPGFSLAFGSAPAASRALVPAPEGVAVQVEATFVEGRGAAQAALAIAEVQAPLELDPAAPERLAALCMAYARGSLETDLHIEWVERVPAGLAGGGIELAGRVEVDGEERVAQFAFAPFGDRQIAISASLPAARFGALGPQVERSLASLRFERPPPRTRDASWRAELGAGVGALLGLAVAMTRLLWRRARVS